MSFGDSVRNAMDNETIEPPKGPYKVTIDEVSTFTSKKGADCTKMILKIVDGEFAGQRFEDFRVWGTPGQKEMHGNALSGYGLVWAEVDDLFDLEEKMRRLIGTEADVSVSYGGDEGQFLNVNVHGSRPPVEQRKSDIPSDSDFSTPAVNKAQSSFAAAAGQKADDSDTIPFAPSVI